MFDATITLVYIYRGCLPNLDDRVRELNSALWAVLVIPTLTTGVPSVWLVNLDERCRELRLADTRSSVMSCFAAGSRLKHKRIINNIP